ncbi:MAG: isoprenoid biosynthesis protein ElbB, partial [Nitrospirae bacterium]
ALERMGARHSACPVEEFVVDRERKVVTTPAYMLGPGVKDVAAGIERCVQEVLALCG